MRENAGFEIIGALRVSPSMEIVIGHRHTDDSWVCWYYSVKGDYYTGGYYTGTYEEAHRKFMQRTETIKL